MLAKYLRRKTRHHKIYWLKLKNIQNLVLTCRFLRQAHYNRGRPPRFVYSLISLQLAGLSIRPFLMKTRSTQAKEYRRLYQSKQWRVLRSEILPRDLFIFQRCRILLVGGRADPRSAVVHHKRAHKGDVKLFYDSSNLQAVCWSCYSGAIQSEEVLGYDTTIGADGWPVDDRHPTY